MGDTYVEQLVKKESSGSQVGLRVLTIAVSFFVTYICMVWIGIIALIPLFALAYLVYYVFQMTSIEYEYIFVNGDLTIDAIFGGNKRKTVASYDLKKCELLAPVTSTYVAGYHRNTQMKTFNFTSGTVDDDAYIVIISYGAGNAKVYFEPNETMVKAMQTALPNKIKLH